MAPVTPLGVPEGCGVAAIWSINIATGLSPLGKVRLLVNSPLPRQEVASLPFGLL